MIVALPQRTLYYFIFDFYQANLCVVTAVELYGR